MDKIYPFHRKLLSPEIVSRRIPKIKSIMLKGKPRFSDFNMLPQDWGANVHAWLVMFAEVYPFLEVLRLKRMTVSDESLVLLARNLTELDIADSVTVDIGGGWLSCFTNSFASLDILNFANLQCEVSFDALERLVSRCRALRVLKVNESINLEQLQRLLVQAPHLTGLGTSCQYEDVQTTFSNKIITLVLNFEYSFVQNLNFT